MKMMILENRRLRTTMQAPTGLISIGSSPDCGVHLPDPKLPAHQASLTQDEGGTWWLEVVDPTVPTCLNRAIQKGRAKLSHADLIEMGPFSIRLFMESQKTQEELRRERMQALTRQHGENLPLGTIIRKPDGEMTITREAMEQITLLAVRLEQAENVTDLMLPIIRLVLRLSDGRRAWIGLRRSNTGDFEWTLATSPTSQHVERPSFSRNMEARVVAHSQYLCVPEAPPADIRSAMGVPILCQLGVLGMLYVENDPNDAPFTEASLGPLSALACSVGLPLENVVRKVAVKRKQTLATELTVARLAQDSLTPKALPQWENLSLAAFRHMGTTRCCDFYDLVQLRDKRASIILARISATVDTVPCYFAELRAAFRVAALYSEPPHLFARALNWVLYDGGKNTIDLACVSVTPGTGRVEYCTAGNGVRLVRIKADGSYEIASEAALLAIGRDRAPAFSSQEMQLSEGDTLVLATEGLCLAKNRTGEALGWEGLEENLSDGLGDSPSIMLSEFARDLTEFLQGGSNPDDLTVFLLQRR